VSGRAAVLSAPSARDSSSPSSWDPTAGIARVGSFVAAPRRLGFISRLGLPLLILRPGGLAKREPGSRRLGRIDEAASHTTDVAEQLAAFPPDRLRVSANLVQSRLRLLPQ
jgi:hypothetical protein